MAQLIPNIGRGSKDAFAIVGRDAFSREGVDPDDFPSYCTREGDALRVNISPESFRYLQRLDSEAQDSEIVRSLRYAQLNGRPRIWTIDFALLHGARTEDDVRQWLRANGARTQAQIRGLRVPVEPVARGSEILVTGSDADVRGYLEKVFNSPKFRLVGSEIELELPLVGKDHLPRKTGETVLKRVRAPKEYSILAPEHGQWWHVVPDDSEETLCTIPLETWSREPRRDDTAAVTCPWCRARMIAIEIAAPPPSHQPEEVGEAARPKLHEEIARILSEAGREMTTGEIAAAVNRAGRYKKRDGSRVTAFQIHGRTKNYPALFERDGNSVRLAR